jgi:hypothetical protein
MQQTRLFLSTAGFETQEQILVEHGPLQVFTFRYPSGVCALRFQNERGSLILLPFQGQQVWSASFDGRDLTMKSMFTQPHPTRTYLENYGGFLLHCGFTAMGVPTAVDSHPLHGELPNAPYECAWIIAGEDVQGQYIELGGEYHHTVAFSTNYLARPRIRLYAGQAVFTAALEVTNLKNTPMEYMYLAHVNFRPMDNAHLVYSAPYDPLHVRVRTSIPSHVHPAPGFADFLQELAADPEKHHLLTPTLAFDPEVVFFIEYNTDADGWAHTLQVHPDGRADYIRHRPDQLDHGVRWICRTPDQDAIGLILPATAEPEGYAAEKSKGNIKTLGPGQVWRCEYVMGALTEAETHQVQQLISRIL